MEITPELIELTERCTATVSAVTELQEALHTAQKEARNASDTLASYLCPFNVGDCIYLGDGKAGKVSAIRASHWHGTAYDLTVVLLKQDGTKGRHEMLVHANSTLEIANDKPPTLSVAEIYKRVSEAKGASSGNNT